MVNRQKELNSLLEKLRKSDTEKNTDIDLVFQYIEKFLEDPSISSGGSKKLMEFEKMYDANSMSKIYWVKWRQTDLERMKMSSGDIVKITTSKTYGED